MAGIKVISGLPGSGKSYYLVDLILKDYYEFDAKYFDYKPKGKVTIVSNIKGLRLPHVSLDSVWANAGCSSLDEFLAIPLLPGHTEEQSVEASKIYKWCMERAPVVFLVDEAQRRWPYSFKNDNVKFFFQYHRHLGVDLYLTTQNWKDLCPTITGLCAFEIRAVNPAKRLLSELKYKTYCEYEEIGKFSLPFSKRVAALYTSFDASEHGRAVRPLRKYLAYAVIMLAILFTSLGFAYSYFSGKYSKQPKKSTATIAPVKQPSQAKPVASLAPTKSLTEQITEKTLAGLADRGIEEQEFVRVDCGAAWIDGKIVAVEFFGQMIPIARFPFQIYPDARRHRAEVVLPADALAQVRPGIWLDNRGVIADNHDAEPDSKNVLDGSTETTDTNAISLPDGRYYSRR